MGGATLTDTLGIPPVKSAEIDVNNFGAAHPFLFITAPQTIPVDRPYVTRIRKLLSVSLPLTVIANTTLLGTFKPEISCVIRLMANGQILAELPCEMIFTSNNEIESKSFTWTGEGSTQFQNPIDISHISMLELSCRGVLPFFSKLYSAEVFVYFNYEVFNKSEGAAGEPPTLAQGRGSFLYTEEDRIFHR